MPSHLWAREYLCNPASEDTALFPQSVLNKATEQYEAVKKSMPKRKYSVRLGGSSDVILQ